MRTLLVDNYDSFTYNLYQLLAEVNGIEPYVVTNDLSNWSKISDLKYDNILISPGPGHPERENDFGICSRLLLETKVPILGVCLGHQGLCSVYGGKVIHAPSPMHGRVSTITHFGDSLFREIPSQFDVVRYHSFVCQEPLPKCFEITARTNDQLIMAIRHHSKPLWGVQFHPESICSEYGYQLLTNFKVLTEQYGSSSTIQQRKKISTPELKPTSRYQVLARKLSVYKDPEYVFQTFFSDKRHAVWLDSSAPSPEMARFSFMGCLDGPLSYFVHYDVTTQILTKLKNDKSEIEPISIFDFLKRELKHFNCSSPDVPFQFNCGFIGYFGYELKSETLGTINTHKSEFPDAQFLFIDRVIVFDELEKSCYLLCLTEKNRTDMANKWFEKMEQRFEALPSKIEKQELNESALKPNYRLSRNQGAYLNNIEECLNYIRNGESYEICLTNKVHLDKDVSASQYYSELRRLNPAPYAAFFRLGDLCIASSSVERFIYIDTRNQIETRPIKGTLPRGKSSEEDEQLRDQLASDEKFKSENLMIVDLLRNDLGRICKIGSVTVPGLMEVKSYRAVHQLVSTIRGQSLEGITAIDAIKALFPGGSMTGAPKLRTVSIIESLEQEARGIYSGIIGYLGLNGCADFNIVIRTATIISSKISIGVGGAIIDLSDPDEEYQEMLLKAQALLKPPVLGNY